MRCVLITPFGMPVEPEVNRNFAMVSGVDVCVRRIDRGGRLRRQLREQRRRPVRKRLRVTTSSTSGGTTASMARAYWLPSQANTRPGVSRLTMWRSLPKSEEISE